MGIGELAWWRKRKADSLWELQTGKQEQQQEQKQEQSRSFALLRMTTLFFESVAVWDGDWRVGAVAKAKSRFALGITDGKARTTARAKARTKQVLRFAQDDNSFL